MMEQLLFCFLMTLNLGKSYSSDLSYFSRIKRADNCLNDCLQGLVNKTSTFTQNSTVMYSDNGKLFLDIKPKDFAVFCPNYKAAKDCTDNCPKTKDKKILSNDMIPSDFLCINRFKDAALYYSCVQEVDKTGVDCAKSCVDKLSQANNAGTNCKAERCLFKCGISQAERKCAKNSIRFVKDYYITLLKKAENEVPKNDKWPKDCSTLQQDLATDKPI